MESRNEKFGKSTLSKSEDWEQWYEELQGAISGEFWPMVDPDQPESVPREPPRLPEVNDVNRTAQIYADLTAPQQRVFDNSYRRANLSVKDWLIYLRDSTKPPEGHMRLVVKRRYDDLFKQTRTQPSVWLDQWEVIINQAIKYNLSELEDGLWLHQLATWLTPLSRELALHLSYQAEDEDSRKIGEFPNVARRVRNHLNNTTKETKIVRGGPFRPALGPTNKNTKIWPTRSPDRPSGSEPVPRPSINHRRGPNGVARA
ncbi:MAG: hypothetical protein MMC33_005737 [Icmadophila ericetorum]|nr:hypothetical protein [Icmadophila ericetorum]